MRLHRLLLRKVSEIPSVWLKVKLFGQNLKRGVDRDLALIELQEQLKHLIEVAETHNETLHSFGNAISELDERTGGDGWGVAVQNAIAHLDNKFDALAEAIGDQQLALTTLKKDWDGFWQKGVVTTDKEEN